MAEFKFPGDEEYRKQLLKESEARFQKALEDDTALILGSLDEQIASEEKLFRDLEEKFKAISRTNNETTQDFADYMEFVENIPEGAREIILKQQEGNAFDIVESSLDKKSRRRINQSNNSDDGDEPFWKHPGDALKKVGGNIKEKYEDWSARNPPKVPPMPKGIEPTKDDGPTLPIDFEDMEYSADKQKIYDQHSQAMDEYKEKKAPWDEYNKAAAEKRKWDKDQQERRNNRLEIQQKEARARRVVIKEMNGSFCGELVAKENGHALIVQTEPTKRKLMWPPTIEKKGQIKINNKTKIDIKLPKIFRTFIRRLDADKYGAVFKDAQIREGTTRTGVTPGQRYGVTIKKLNPAYPGQPPRRYVLIEKLAPGQKWKPLSGHALNARIQDCLNRPKALDSTETLDNGKEALDSTEALDSKKALDSTEDLNNASTNTTPSNFADTLKTLDFDFDGENVSVRKRRGKDRKSIFPDSFITPNSKQSGEIQEEINWQDLPEFKTANHLLSKDQAALVADAKKRGGTFGGLQDPIDANKPIDTKNKFAFKTDNAAYFVISTGGASSSSASSASITYQPIPIRRLLAAGIDPNSLRANEAPPKIPPEGQAPNQNNKRKK